MLKITQTYIILSALLLAVFNNAFATENKGVKPIEILTSFLAVSLNDNKCTLHYYKTDLTLENHPCIMEVNNNQKMIYSDPTQPTKLTYLNPITQQLALDYEFTIKQPIATIMSDGEIDVDLKLLSHTESFTKPCAPLNICEKILADKADLLITQDDFGYLIKDNFGRVQLQRKPFTLQFISGLIILGEIHVSGAKATFITDDILTKDYHGNLMLMSQTAFVSGQVGAEYNDTNQHYIFVNNYLKTFKEIDEDEERGVDTSQMETHSSHGLFYTAEDDRRINKIASRGENFVFSWKALGIGKHINNEWTETPFNDAKLNELYFAFINQDNQRNQPKPEEIKYVKINFVDQPKKNTSK